MTNENYIKFASFNGSVRSGLSMRAFNGKAVINDFSLSDLSPERNCCWPFLRPVQAFDRQ